ncbi:hypothetical protein BOTBODRAFT_112281, partial [Botryobasidium botryosum FD-172 SS1]
ILMSNLIVRVRSLVTACRASGQRRANFRQTIIEGNNNGLFALDVLQLLRDVDTRWSSLFLMVDRVLELSPVS